MIQTLIDNRLASNCPSNEALLFFSMSTFSMPDKKKLLTEYFQNTNQYLAPIPEEAEKIEEVALNEWRYEEKEMSITKDQVGTHDFDDDVSTLDTTQKQKSIVPQRTKFCQQPHRSDPFSSLRMQYMIDKDYADSMFRSIRSKQEKALTSASLYKRVFLSSLIDVRSDFLSSASLKTNNISVCMCHPSLAYDNIDLNLRVINDKVNLASLCSSSLCKTNSYFSFSRLQSGGSVLTNRIQESLSTNPLIVKTKSEIKSQVNFNPRPLATSSRLFPQNPYPSLRYYSSKSAEKTKTKNVPTKIRSFYQTFSLASFGNGEGVNMLMK